MSSMDQALQTLETALSRLDSALDALFEQSGDPAILRRELQVMSDDRARLAADLDAALAREAELQSLADEASAALGSAIAEVKAALELQETASGQG
ncbi:MAG: DUF4164 family protein [Pseudomonadota bacterium]